MKTLFLLLCLLCPAPLIGQQTQNFAYEVSTVRPNTSGSSNSSANTTNDSYRATNQSLTNVLQTAFNLQTADQIVGLPGWAGGSHYDISAKMDAETMARLKALKREDRGKAQDEMMQGLLAERFGLQVHHETRELPEYALVQAKGGSKLKPADPANPKAGNMSVNNGKMEAYSAEMKQLGYFLAYQVHRPVADRTGLTGKFDLVLEWTREDVTNASADGTADPAPGLFTAIQEQMGLKLESIKGPVDVIVIDHIQPPTEN